MKRFVDLICIILLGISFQYGSIRFLAGASVAGLLIALRNLKETS